VSLRGLGTYVDTSSTTDAQGTIEGAGVIGGFGTSSNLNVPRFKYFASVQYKLDSFSATLMMRGVLANKYYVGAIECTSSCPTSSARAPTIGFDNKTPAWNVFDLSLSYQLAKVQLTFVAENLFDTAPPLIAGAVTNGYYAGQNNSSYDRIGRNFRLSARFKY
jgi:iron complex outermembrane receptor protein